MNPTRIFLFYLRALTALVAATAIAPLAHAAELVTQITQNGTGLNAQQPIASSATTRLPQPEGAGTSGGLGDEAYVSVTRTHEYTAVRTDSTTGLLTTAGTGNLQAFPTYLVGLEYVQFANENRPVANYSVDMTFSQAVKAYLFLDNRINGASSGTKAQTTDPTLSGNTAWVLNDGWTRVNTGFMPNGQADYLGLDEGATVASADLRTHTSTGLVAGSGNGLNQFAAIYTKNFDAGPNIGVTKAIGNGSIDFYGVAFQAIVPEPSSLSLCFVGGLCAWGMMKRRSTR